MTEKLIEKILLSIFSVVILGGIIQYGIANRPIVGYKLECPSKISIPRYSFSENISSTFKLGISNSGNTDASLILHFRCNNATISIENKKPYTFLNSSDIFIYLTASKNSPQYYFGEQVQVIINKSITSFSCRYEVLKNPDNSISGIINRFFGEVKGYYPVSCEYNKVKDEFILKE